MKNTLERIAVYLYAIFANWLAWFETNVGELEVVIQMLAIFGGVSAIVLFIAQMLVLRRKHVNEETEGQIRKLRLKEEELRYEMMLKEKKMKDGTR